MECPLCGVGLTDARPRYRIRLTSTDETSPSTVPDDEETGLDRYVCRDCWRDIQRDFG